jgi:hypothetical protein
MGAQWSSLRAVGIRRGEQRGLEIVPKGKPVTPSLRSIIYWAVAIFAPCALAPAAAASEVPPSFTSATFQNHSINLAW